MFGSDESGHRSAFGTAETTGHVDERALIPAPFCCQPVVWRFLLRLVFRGADAGRSVVVAGPGEHCGASQESSAVDLPPHIDTSDQPLPGPAPRFAAPGRCWSAISWR